jgi:hypothetical protein
MKLLLFFLLFPFIAFSQNTAKPWAYWWWMGSAVNKTDLKQNLESYSKAGFGGLHIIPIYGVKGEENKFIKHLSPEWLEMLNYTVEEANRLGMGIDMTVGTGWPFGGSHVSEADAAKAFKLIQKNDKYEVITELTKQQVKRAAPGGEGLVIDHFNKASVEQYFKPFEEAFNKKNYGIRAFYNDSYEVYGANWTSDFLDEFKKRRNYDLSPYLGILNKKTAETEQEKRIWSDYHETLSDLVYDEFTKTFVSFGHQFNKLIRNEAHGSPANILDLYALSDIPESEFFGSKPYDIPLYRQDPDYEEARFGKPDELVLKLASSAAHISGKKLVASETSTWLGNHFKVALSQIKPIIDESFVGGINHFFYHGLPYSPPNEPFPGWLFYASTNYNQNSHFYNELPLLNKYIENCQTMLQKAKSDNDVLVYFPIYDMWHSAGTKAKTHAIDVHNISKGGIFDEQFRKLLNDLKTNGFGFDFVSDRQILKSKFKDKIITEGDAKYQVILIPKIDYLPLETLEKLNDLRKSGAKIIFSDKLPQFVNGFYNYQKRQKDFDKMIVNFKESISNNTIQSLLEEQIRYEPMAKDGLSYIRKKTERGQLYFICNQSKNDKVGNLRLQTAANALLAYNPLTEKEEYINFTKAGGFIEFPIQLESGESIIIETNRFLPKDSKAKLSDVFRLPQLKTPLSNGRAIGGEALQGSWNIEFLRGNPFIPKPYKTENLTSWTNAPDTTTTYFSGVAKYSLKFEIADNQVDKAGFLYLGDVRETAKVTLNGQSLGTVWCLPFKVQIPKGLLNKENLLEIEITNTSANRIRYIDKMGVKWRKFYDINMVDINYKPFDASKWKPIESGLLGPVKLVLD